jgi:F-type H+-transporting ATPase subunit epsilon
MAKQFRLQVFTQEKKVLDENISSLIVPGADGYFGVLADHAPLIASLGQGKLTVISGGGERKYAISGGFLEVVQNQATILADTLTAA